MIPWTALSAICQTVIMIKPPIQRQHIPRVEHCETFCKAVRDTIKHCPCLSSQRMRTHRWSLAHQHLVSSYLDDEDKEETHQKIGVRDAGKTCEHGLLELSNYNELMTHLCQQLPVELGSPNAATSSAFYMLSSHSPH